MTIKAKGLGFLIVLLCSSAFAQTQSWVTRRISNNLGYSSRPSIAISGSNVYITWDDDTLGNTEIFIKSSKNGGATWSLQKNISNNSGESWASKIVASGAYLYIIWQDNTLGNSEVFFKRSKDGGLTWSNSKRIASMSGDSQWPSIVAKDKQVYIVWTDSTPGNYEIYFIMSNDAGTSWTPIKRLTNTAGDSWWPEIAIEGSNIYLVWQDDSSGHFQINFKRSINGGKNWKAATRFTSSSADSMYPCLAVVEPFIYAVWGDYIDDQARGINFKKSSNKGVTWGATSLFDTQGGDVDIIAKESNLYVVWDNSGLIYSRSDDQGESWTDPIKLTYKVAGRPQIIVDELSKVYIVYAELISDLQGNWDIYLKYSKN